MPKRGKLTKKTRDRAMIAGIRKHKEVFDRVRGTKDAFDVDAFLAMLEAHLETLEDVDTHTRLRSEAVALEKKQEAARVPCGSASRASRARRSARRTSRRSTSA